MKFSETSCYNAGIRPGEGSHDCCSEVCIMGQPHHTIFDLPVLFLLLVRIKNTKTVTTWGLPVCMLP